MAKNLGPLLVAVGTIGAPAAQWLVFWLVARTGGAVPAGEFALLLAVSTPLFAFTNFGLRNSYLTLIKRHRFVFFGSLRLVGTVIGSIVLLTFGVATDLNALIVTAVVIQKCADAVLDIFFGYLQRERRLFAFGLLMTANALATGLIAVIASRLTESPGAIILASAAGSTFALFCCLASLAPRISAFFLSTRQKQEFLNAGLSYNLILRSSWPIAVGHLLSALVINLPTWGVGVVGTEDEVGRFAGIAYFLTLGSLLGTTLNVIYISEYQSTLKTHGSRAVLRRSVSGSSIITGIGMVFALLLAVFGDELLPYLYGSDFKVGSVSLLIIGIAAALNPGTQLMNAGLLVMNRYRDQMMVVAWASIAVALSVMTLGVFDVPSVLLGCMSALVGSVAKTFFSLLYLRHTSSTSDE